MRKIPERLRDIQDAIARIMKYTREGRYRYDHDELVQTWVTHNLYVIGEAARAIASDFPDSKINIQRSSGLKSLGCEPFWLIGTSILTQMRCGQRSLKIFKT